MVDYCDIQFSWDCDKDPNYVTDYFLDQDVTGDGQDSMSFPSKLEISRCNEEDGSQCELTIQCKPFYHVGITGVRVISEARNVEVYSRLDGYLQTVRGKSVPEADNIQYYISDFAADEPALNFSFKFLSLKNKSFLELKRVQISLTQMEPRADTSQMDLKKLRNQVQELGDKVSDKAKCLLETMEQYQKNQMGTLDSVRSMLSESSIPPEKSNSLSGMAGLLSMFSQMNHRTSRKLNTSATTPNEDSSHPGELADRVLSQMSAGQNGDSLQSEDMYNFLHSVCGKVSKLRHSPKKELTDDSVEHEKSTESSSNTADQTLSPAVIALVTSQIQAVEERVVSRLQSQMSEMEARLNRKMDRILQLLCSEGEDRPFLRPTVDSNPDDLRFLEDTPSPQPIDLD